MLENALWKIIRSKSEIKTNRYLVLLVHCVKKPGVQLPAINIAYLWLSQLCSGCTLELSRIKLFKWIKYLTEIFLYEEMLLLPLFPPSRLILFSIISRLMVFYFRLAVCTCLPFCFQATAPFLQIGCPEISEGHNFLLGLQYSHF